MVFVICLNGVVHSVQTTEFHAMIALFDERVNTPDVLSDDKNFWRDNDKFVFVDGQNNWSINRCIIGQKVM